MIKFLIFVSIFLNSCNVTDIHADYPYLRKGEVLYKDIISYTVKENTSLEKVFKNSHFYSLPEFLDFTEKFGLIYEADKKLILEGDGGFSGIIMKKNSNFPEELVIIFPDMIKDRELLLKRTPTGWQVLKYYN